MNAIEKGISRRRFLVGAGAVGLGVGVAREPITAFASDPLPPLPWPYPPDGLNPEDIRQEGYCLYYLEGGCGHGAAQAILDALAEAQPEPWARLPRGLYSYGAGGAVGWGTICGALNGVLGVMDILGVHGLLGNAVMDYYSNTELPTDELVGWVPDDTRVPIPLADLPKSVSFSPLCHNSVSSWAAVAGVPIADPTKKDRCAKLVGDVVAYAVALMNDWFLRGIKPAAWAPPDAYESCYSCHTQPDMIPSQQGKMDCRGCHEVAPAHGSWRKGKRNGAR